MSVEVPISWGELLDKISILEIKAERLDQPDKLANVRHELTKLVAIRDHASPADPSLDEAASELREVNLALWDIEDEIRDCERRQDFGPRFVELARSVYRSNDRRSAIKQRINRAAGSDIVEEKSYTEY